MNHLREKNDNCNIKKGKKRGRRMAAVLMLMLSFVIMYAKPIHTYAASPSPSPSTSTSSGEKPYQFLLDGESNGVFDPVIGVVEQTSKSGMELGTSIGIAVSVISFLFGIASLVMASAQKKSEAKSKILYAIAGFFGVICLGSIVAIIYSVSTNLNSSVGA